MICRKIVESPGILIPVLMPFALGRYYFALVCAVILVFDVPYMIVKQDRLSAEAGFAYFLVYLLMAGFLLAVSPVMFGFAFFLFAVVTILWGLWAGIPWLIKRAKKSSQQANAARQQKISDARYRANKEQEAKRKAEDERMRPERERQVRETKLKEAEDKLARELEIASTFTDIDERESYAAGARARYRRTLIEIAKS